jgi:hypothetical protein
MYHHPAQQFFKKGEGSRFFVKERTLVSSSRFDCPGFRWAEEKQNFSQVI